MEEFNITNFTTNVNNIQALSDRPNTIDGLTSQELKAKFDKAGNDIKTYINGTMIPEIESGINGISESLPIDYVKTSDERLADSRKCNNDFDNPINARNNLKIQYGTVLPTDAEEGTLFFLY